MPLKTFFMLFALVAVMLAVYPFLKPSGNDEAVTGLPWQIDIQADGSTRVFGLHIGHSRLSDAYRILGRDMELAIIAASDESGKLEMYYGHYQAGLLSGKLVLQTGADEQDIRYWRENAAGWEYMASGLAKKYRLSDENLVQILGQTIIGLTFIPVTNLDEAVIVARFGQPEKKLVLSGVTHYLYPHKGLDIALYSEAKEVLQYVSPDAFGQLVAPLISQ